VALEARAERARQSGGVRYALALLAIIPLMATSLPAAAASQAGKPGIKKVVSPSKKAALGAKTSKKVSGVSRKRASSASRTSEASPRDQDSAATVVNASWYGSAHHGQRTASGERFDRDALTAAHRTLPFGTRLKVTSVRTGKQVVVTVNDRGPHTRNRGLDLSEAAAYRLGLVEQGTGQVRIAVLDSSVGRTGADANGSFWHTVPPGSLDGVNLAANPAAAQPASWR
jgi:rare lipoprotein A